MALGAMVAFALLPPPAAAAPRAPAGPPLLSHAAASNASPQAGHREEGASFAQSVGEGDPLVGNGLGSPLCSRPTGAGGLSPAGLRNCRTSGFLAAPAATANYAFDVNMEHGFLGLDPMALFQDYVLGPVWMALVWVVHALLVMLEWCYSIDLLDSGSTMGEVGRGLRQAQATFTDPWLVTVLAVASVLTLYHGLVRRQVAQTIGQALLMMAMMAGGLWTIADPAGTVGALGEWANQASLGTLGAVAQGTPGAGARPLSEGMRTVFAYGIEAPWCYMEFGDVRWCRDPALLDPRLRKAGLSMAREEHAKIGCTPTSELFARFTGERPASELFSECAARGSELANAYTSSAEQLRAAQTNGELFLALPANGKPRNSVSTSGALLNVLCESTEIDKCHGPTAAQAEFRNAGATGQRAAGLLLILVGAAGMVMVLGFIALHLLGAALLSLLYLLLAPAAVLAPALGDGGRAVFRGWATRLLGTLMSKLLFSLLLGTLLLMARILLSLQGLGWWTQWLLVSALWWGAYRHRHQVVGFAHGEHRPAGGAGSTGARLLKQAPRQVVRGAGWVKGKLSQPGGSVERRHARDLAVRQRARAQADEQVGRTLEQEHGQARAQVRAAPQIQAQLAAKQGQLARVRGEHGKAQQDGDTRRAARLGVRAQRIEGDIAHQQQALSAARRVVGEGERAQRTGGRAYTRERHEARARFLDAQAALPAGVEAARAGVGVGAGGTTEAGMGAGARGGTGAGGGGRTGGGTGPAAPAQRRDYAALASLAGYGRAEYERLDPHRRRQARLQIDRELALRKELNGAAEQLAEGGTGSMGRRELGKVNKDFDRTVEQRLQDGGHDLPSSRQPRSGPVDAWLAQARSPARGPISDRSPVMRDIHDVAQRRKRQLGRPARR